MPQLPAFTRRRILQVGSVGLTGLTLPGVLRAESRRGKRAQAKACILLYMDGGPSHIDLLDLKPHAPVEVRGPWQPIPTTVPGIEVAELMPLMARQMHNLTLIRSVRHQELVHDPAVYQMLTGFKHVSSAGGLKVEDTDLPQMGAAFGRADETLAVMPKVVELPETMKMEGRVLPGQNAGILGATFDPFRVDVTPEANVLPPPFARNPDVADARLAQRSALLQQFNQELCRLQLAESTQRFDRFQEQALGILAAPQTDLAFDLGHESDAIRDLYGKNRHGQSVLLARRLIEAGTRFVTVYWGREPQDWADGRGARPANNPWDTHRNHFPLVRDSLVPRADRALAALLADLRDRGQLDETLVVWMGDFGRTPKITKPWASRDHWPHAFSILMAGAGVPQSSVYGATDNQAAFVTDRPVSPADITATIFDKLGVDPQTNVRDASGREHVLSQGLPIDFT